MAYSDCAGDLTKCPHAWVIHLQIDSRKRQQRKSNVGLNHCIGSSPRYLSRGLMYSTKNATCSLFIECDWEDIPAASKKTSHSKAWFIVDVDAVHIRTSSFSCWAIFGAGTKRRRAVVLASEVDPGCNKISLRFYVYSDSKDSRMVRANLMWVAGPCLRRALGIEAIEHRGISWVLPRIWTMDKEGDK